MTFTPRERRGLRGGPDKAAELMAAAIGDATGARHGFHPDRCVGASPPVLHEPLVPR